MTMTISPNPNNKPAVMPYINPKTNQPAGHLQPSQHTLTSKIPTLPETTTSTQQQHQQPPTHKQKCADTLEPKPTTLSMTPTRAMTSHLNNANHSTSITKSSSTTTKLTGFAE
jgi:hypothetical protein